MTSPLSAQNPVPDFSIQFSPSTIGIGSTTQLTYSITNNTGTPIRNLSFENVLPAGLALANAANPKTTCAGASITLIAPNNGNTVQFSGAGIGAFSTCTVTVNVVGTALGTHTNITGDLLSDAGNSGTAMANLNVVDTVPGFSKSFSPASIDYNGISTLTFTLDYSQGSGNVFSLTFSDILPDGLVIASPSNATTNCTGASVNAVPGGSVITMFSGFMTGGEVCTVSVDVTSIAPGEKVNVSQALNGSTGQSGFATAVLDVGPRPAFTKTFLDDAVLPGSVVDLQFSITNLDRRNGVTGVSFTDDLNAFIPGATALDLPSNGVCGSGALLSGNSEIVLSGGELGPGETCVFNVAVMIPAGATPGTYTNTTSELTNDGGFMADPASGRLTVLGGVSLEMAFLDSTVANGGMTTLEWTVTNLNASSSANDISFLLITNTALPGLTFPSLPLNDVCGSGSTLTQFFNGFDRGVMFTGGSLPAGGTCTFSVPVDISSDSTTGSYTFTTGDISATIGEETVLGNQASATLQVASAPTLTKIILDNPASSGGTATLSYTLTHDENGIAPATNIAFSVDLDSALSGLEAIGLPNGGICGESSLVSGSGTISFSGGTLNPGESCSFTVQVQVPETALTGLYAITSSDVSADVDGLAVTSPPAIANLEIAGLSLEKTFVGGQAVPGGTVDLVFTLTNISTTSTISNIDFTDNLSNTLSGLTATGLPQSDVCGTGALLIGTNFLVFSGGELAPSTSCTVTVPLQVPASATPGEYLNITSSVTGDVGGSPVTAPAASDLLEILAPLTITKTFLDNPVLAGGTARVEYTITNSNQTASATGIAFTDDFGSALSGLAATGLPSTDVCGTGAVLSGTDVLTLSGGELGPGASCTFEVTLQVPAGAPIGSQVVSTTSAVTATVGGSAVTADPASDTLYIEFLEFSKSFSGGTGPGGTTTLTFTITNPNPTSPASNVSFSDDLDAVMPGMTAVGLPLENPCGSGSTVTGQSIVEFTNGRIQAGGTCEFSVTVQIPQSATAGTYTNTTSLIQATVAGVSGASRAASADLTVHSAPQFSKAFAPAVVANGGTSTLTFTIDNTASGANATSLNFIDNLPAGMVVAGTPNISDGCFGTVSAAPGATSIDYSDGIVFAGSVCTISVDVIANNTGTLVNTTQALTSSSGNSGTASASLVVGQPPGFAKTFTPAVVNLGSSSRLTFTIDNSANPVAATNLSFVDNLPAGLIVANPPNISGKCAGGSLAAFPGGNSVSLSGGTVDAGEVCTFAIDVTATAPGTLTNITQDLTSDFGNSGNATASIDVVANADLSVAIGASPDPVDAGSDITYTVTVTNNGPADAQNVVVSSQLDPNTTFQSSSGCDEDPTGNGTCTLGTIAANSSAQFTVTAAVSTGYIGDLTFQAQATSTTPEANPGDESAAITTQAVQLADLDITTKILGNPHPGDTIRIRIKIKNKGPSRVKGLEVYIPFPSDTFQDPSWTCNATGGSFCTGSGKGDIDDVINLKKSGKATYLVEATLLQVIGKISFQAEIKPPKGIHDPDMSDNIAYDEALSTSPAMVVGSLRLLDPIPDTELGIFPKTGDRILLEAELTNQSQFKQFDNPLSHEFSQTLPTGMTLVSAEVLGGGGTLKQNLPTSSLYWNGAIESFEKVRIQIQAELGDDAATLPYLAVQGTIQFDSDGDGVNESQSLSDDPNQPGEEDPTVLMLKGTAVPTLSPFALVLLFTGLIAIAIFLKRRRSAQTNP